MPETDDVGRFIIAGNSELQVKLLDQLERVGLSPSALLHVEGPHRIWLKRVPQFYFSLRVSGDSKQQPSNPGEEESTKDDATPTSQLETNSEGQCSSSSQKKKINS